MNLNEYYLLTLTVLMSSYIVIYADIKQVLWLIPLICAYAGFCTGIDE